MEAIPNMNNINKSSYYYYQVIHYFELLNLENNVTNFYNNLGILHEENYILDSSICYYNKPLLIPEKLYNLP